MFENYREPLIPRRRFIGRLARHALGALAMVTATLWIGMAGYHWLEGLS